MTSLAANLAALARRAIGGAANNLVALDGAGNLPPVPGHQLTGLAFSKAHESAELSIVAGGQFSYSHTLGGKPKIIAAFLLCKVAESNFVVGDETPIAVFGENISQPAGVQLTYSATAISGVFGTYSSTFQPLNKTLGSFAGITNANWRLVLRAFA